MRVACVVAHGGLKNLKLQDWPEPKAGPGQALVQVKACGLNYLDIFVRRGMPGLPVELPRVAQFMEDFKNSGQLMRLLKSHGLAQ